jgi:hypothetical protein
MPLPGTKHACGAKTREGTPCQNPTMKNGRCRMHGGASLRGTDLPQFKHGRYSKSVPDRLVARYEEALSDEERHDLRDEIALSEAKVADLLSKMDSGESDSGWIYLKGLADRMRRAKEGERASLLSEILRTIREGAGESLAWQDTERWMARKQRLVEGDLRVAQVKQEMVSAEEVMALVAALVDAVRRHVGDRETRLALAREIRDVAERRGVVAPIGRAGEHARNGSEE